MDDQEWSPDDSEWPDDLDARAHNDDRRRSEYVAPSYCVAHRRPDPWCHYDDRDEPLAPANEPDAQVPADSLLGAALVYARAGWPVFPVIPNKRPLTPHGFLDATVDEQRITRWWQQVPDA